MTDATRYPYIARYYRWVRYPRGSDELLSRALAAAEEDVPPPTAAYKASDTGAWVMWDDGLERLAKEAEGREADRAEAEKRAEMLCREYGHEEAEIYVADQYAPVRVFCTRCGTDRLAKKI